MRRLVVPPNTVPYSERHIRVVRSKKSTVAGVRNEAKETLLELEPRLVERFSDFEDAVSGGTLFEFLEDDAFLEHKEALLGCYSGRTSKVKEIFRLIEGAQERRFLKRCPYCGVTLPKTYDHYLPENKFPELSVHALNLIPCCDYCNKTKSVHWKNSQHRTFLHFYSDKIPVEQYLYVHLSSMEDQKVVSARFFIERPEGVSDDEWSVLSSHYDKLGLIATYNELANDEICEIFNACVSHLRHGGSDSEGFLASLLSPDERLYGLNHWRVVLMRALCECDDFFVIVVAGSE